MKTQITNQLKQYTFIPFNIFMYSFFQIKLESTREGIKDTFPSITFPVCLLPIQTSSVSCIVQLYSYDEMDRRNEVVLWNRIRLEWIVQERRMLILK